MDLPVRILDEPPPEPVVCVDGAFGALGLELSHWPGNRTPENLRHDLSTGSALAFARLPQEEQDRLAGDATAIVNNHYDTDGCCALFAARRPDEALARAERLLDAARAGDFFRIPDLGSLAIDAIVGGLDDPDRSPLAPELVGRSDLERWQIAVDHLMERLDAVLDGDREPYRALWEPVVERARADLARLEGCAREERSELDLTIWTAAGHGTFAPGRHALFGSTASDRVLAIGPADDGGDGTTWRLVLSTLSWFDLVTIAKPPRPDLGALAERLNELEGSDPAGPAAWRAQARTNASPEFWFGAADLESFAEHNDALRPSALAPALVREEILGALVLLATS
ncbi:MAG: hypothetical protein O7B99_06940 [Planctomycetota bacterium]|nr:hypothetical protein [Planctomycetota bacterium]